MSGRTVLEGVVAEASWAEVPTFCAFLACWGVLAAAERISVAVRLAFLGFRVKANEFVGNAWTFVVTLFLLAFTFASSFGRAFRVAASGSSRFARFELSFGSSGNWLQER